MQGESMLEAEPAKKAVVHVGEDQKYGGKPAFIAMFEYLARKKIWRVAVTRGIAGFGADHQMHTIMIERLTENLPIQIEFVAPQQKMDEVVPELCEMVGTGLIEIQDTCVSIEAVIFSEKSPPPRRKEGRAQLLRVFVGENETWGGKRLSEALLESMRANDIAGVTVYRGLAGYGENAETYRDQINLAFSDHPVTVIAIDAEEKIRAFLPFLDQMLPRGLVVLSEVDTVRYTHDFHSVERRSGVR
jgi:PII-like signaling protein